MSLYACIKTIRLGTTTGTQTITGIHAADGTAFTPAHIFFIGGTGRLETLWSNGSNSYNTVSVDRGWYNAATGKRQTQGIAEYPYVTAPLKIASGSGGGRAYSSLEASFFFGGDVYRTCDVTAVRLGEFDLQTLTNLGYFTIDVMCVCLGGSGLQAELLDFSGGSGNKATSFASKGVLNFELDQTAGSAVLTGAGGGGGHGGGFDSPNGGGYAAHGFIQGNGGNYRIQRTGMSGVGIDATTGAAIAGSSITAWTPSYVTVAYGTGGTNYRLSFGGDTIRTATGSVRASTTTGTQVINIGVNAKWVYLLSVGRTNATSTSSDWVEMCQGWAAGSSQSCNWWGESRTGSTLPLLGASYISSSSVLRFANSAGPQGSATVFGAVAELVSIRPDGFLTIHWSTNDGVDRDLLWFALGEDAEPDTPSYTLVPLTERRMRQAPHIVSELNRQFISKFQIHLQPGIGQGTGQGADPMVMFQYSKDGGHTWSNERLLPAGKVGQYARRCIAWRLGVGRDWCFRVSVTDPNVPWALVAAYLDGSEGVS